MWRLGPSEHCAECKLDGQAVVLGEKAIVGLAENAFRRHPGCGHVIAYRSLGGPLFSSTSPVVEEPPPAPRPARSLEVASYTDGGPLPPCH